MFCPRCGAALQARRVRGEGEWAQSWRRGLTKDQQFVPFGELEADVVTPCGTVVELQHGSLAEVHICQRERVYGLMVWLFFAVQAHTNKRLSLDLRPGKPLVSFNWRGPRETMAACRRPIYLDLGASHQAGDLHLLLKPGKTYPRPGWLAGNGLLYTAEAFHNWMAHGVPLSPWIPTEASTADRVA